MIKKSKKVSDVWDKFREADGTIPADEPFQIWYFGNSQAMSVELADLVIAGTKTATASLLAMNELQPDTAPVIHGYSIVTDFEGEPKCIIRTVEVRHRPFEEVDAQFAFDEGEGDRTLEHWRKVHHDYFSREATQHGMDFGPKSIICCERFRLLDHS